ncbi:MAG: SH3 domain-containing protein [Proteobacteria bacterium]|nr:SH3 domain-containing protein [Pseudomonadota bacterium]MBU1137991.1 SH3 domain-containing protein [Pseudomonadota bacterium]MBU1231518.1 SH3 domain-containing protein [Pseudomonadota bacterium]MBU1420219.1 SH3 domain-containing protein [Pseudomonadota bacterium]MBU1455548.1 SH3 domain-containing protein [Pseudomonadota bacterium]
MKNLSIRLKHILPFIFIITFLATSALAEMGSVKGNKVQLRSGPGTTYSVKWEYGNGFPLKILSKKGDWIKVTDFENDSGWIHKDYVGSTPYMIVKVNKGKKKKINLRSGPGVGYKIVGRAYYGVVFETLGQEKGWAKIKHESGLTGWIKRSLLWGF